MPCRVEKKLLEWAANRAAAVCLSHTIVDAYRLILLETRGERLYVAGANEVGSVELSLPQVGGEGLRLAVTGKTFAESVAKGLTGEYAELVVEKGMLKIASGRSK